MPVSSSFDAFRIQHRMLMITGIWPVESPNATYKLGTMTSWFFTLSLFGILLIQFIYDIHDLFKLTETLYIMISYMGFIGKLSITTYRRKELLGIINFLKEPIFSSYPEDLDHYMAKTIKYFTFLANFFRYVMGGLMVLYFVYPILDGKSLPFSLPYHLGNYTILMYAFQMIAEVCSAFNHLFCDMLCWTLMAIAAAQLDILAGKIIRFKEINKLGDWDILKDKETNKKLKQIVEHHLAIIRVVNSIEHVFSMVLLSQFISSATVICNTIFRFVLVPVSSEFFMLADYFILLLIQLFMYCWYGNEIIVKSSQIGEACYLSKWYLTNSSARKYLFIIMERSKRPLKLTAMKLSPLSLIAFVSILQWSYSYLTLLLKMYSKQSPQSVLKL